MQPRKQEKLKRFGLYSNRNEWPVAEIDYASSAQALSMVKGDVNSLLFAGINPDFCPNELCFAAGELEISNPESIPSHPHGFMVRSDYQCPRPCPLYPLPPRPPVSARLAL
jgi:hypothetical protein